jgi:hypothetical protein
VRGFSGPVGFRPTLVLVLRTYVPVFPQPNSRPARPRGGASDRDLSGGATASAPSPAALRTHPPRGRGAGAARSLHLPRSGIPRSGSRPGLVLAAVARGHCRRAGRRAVGTVAPRYLGRPPMPECDFRAHDPNRRAVTVAATIDTAPQAYFRLERAAVEASQSFNPSRIVAPPEDLPGLGLDADWFPAETQLSDHRRRAPDHRQVVRRHPGAPSRARRVGGANLSRAVAASTRLNRHRGGQLELPGGARGARHQHARQRREPEAQNPASSRVRSLAEAALAPRSATSRSCSRIASGTCLALSRSASREASSWRRAIVFTNQRG